MSIGEGLPAISRKLFEKIRNNEYIEFTDLPPARGKHRSLLNHLEGQVLLVQLQDLEDTRRIIPDFPTWNQCFTIFAAALVTHQPERLPQLMAYQYQMASYAKKFRWPTWVMYDQQYRLEKAASQDNNWSQISTAIYAQCFMVSATTQDEWCRTCYTFDHTSSSCPRTLHPPKRYKRQESSPHQKTCDDYNSRDKFCTRQHCKFLHICQLCKGQHPQFRCSKRGLKGADK